MDSTAPPLDHVLTDAVIQVLGDLTGPGPTKARAFVNGDTAVVMMYDTLTARERSLVDDGREREVTQLRHAYQRAMADDVSAVVERVMQRHVNAFMSANHVDPDHSVEVFVLGDPF